MKHFIILFIIFGMLVSCKEDKASLNGKIILREKAIAFSQMKVELLQNGKSISKTEPDYYGDYKFDSLLAGSYDLKVRSSGCDDKFIKSIHIIGAKKLDNIIFPDSCVISKRICPKDPNDKVIPIAYGLPGKEMEKDAEEGKIHLGGCIMGYCNPKWYCEKHNLEF